MSKICKSCGMEVEDNANFCPGCKGQAFTRKNEIAVSSPTPVHRIFYWDYEGKHVISRAKITSILVFVFFCLCMIESGNVTGFLILGIIVSIFVYVMGFAIHKMISRPSQAKLDNGEYGLATDLKHFFFYWQNDSGQYVLSKTKLLSHLIFILFFICGITVASPVLGVCSAIVFALLFEIPAYLIGYAIHRFTNPNPQPKIEKKQPPKPKVEHKTPQIRQRQTIPEYADYVRQLDELNSKFIRKEKSTRQMIEKRFEPPQLTYTRFITGVDKSRQLFDKNLESAWNMISIADSYSPRIAGEIEEKIGILNAIVEKMDGLLNELVVNEDITEKGDVDDLIGEMDSLIDSVKDYD